MLSQEIITQFYGQYFTTLYFQNQNHPTAVPLDKSTFTTIAPIEISKVGILLTSPTDAVHVSNKLNELARIYGLTVDQVSHRGSAQMQNV